MDGWGWEFSYRMPRSQYTSAPLTGFSWKKSWTMKETLPLGMASGASRGKISVSACLTFAARSWTTNFSLGYTLRSCSTKPPRIPPVAKFLLFRDGVDFADAMRCDELMNVPTPPPTSTTRASPNSPQGKSGWKGYRLARGTQLKRPYDEMVR